MKDLRPIHTLWLTLSTVLILLAVSTVSIPSNAICGIHSIDMFSALTTDNDSSSDIPSDERCQTADEDYSVDNVRNTKLTAQNIDQTIDTDDRQNPNKISTDDSTEYQSSRTLKVLVSDEGASEISANEPASQTATNQAAQFDGEGGISIENSEALAPFFNKLRSSSGNHPVRIAVLGDSFIEGDIFTQDLREMFQDRFGGNGVGFVPMASNVAGFRQTVTHTFSGWTTHCISTAARRGNYTISSYTYTPGDGSVSRYTTTTKRRHLSSFSRARLLFINNGSTSINARINDNSPQQFTPTSSGRLQQITLASDSIRSIDFSFRSADSFTAYGVYLDGTSGVAVDNYSVRGNSGISLASTSTELLSQMNALMPIDLIILEYGLNVAQADSRNYSQYQTQMRNAITHLQKAFPNAAILLMSVPDRAHRTAAGWQTMPGIKAMEKMQRQLSAQCGIAFWSTMKNMQQRGGMGTFVKNGWAAKDYTHLSHKGGRVVARSLFDAIIEQYGN